MATQSNQYAAHFLTDYDGSQVEVSLCLRNDPVNRDMMDMNHTTFAAGGGPVTEKHKQGAVQSQIQPDFLFDPDAYAVLQRIVGLPGGITWISRFGNNAAPTYGDAQFWGTYTLFGITINYPTLGDATMQLDLRPTDSGSIVPAWTTV